MREVAEDLDVSYYTAINHRDRLSAQGKIRQVKRAPGNRGVFVVTCPDGAGDERGVDRDLVAEPPRVIRWS
jgi:hypothetical protein